MTLHNHGTYTLAQQQRTATEQRHTAKDKGQDMDLHSGVLKGFDSGTYTATVQLTGSLAQWLRTVPVSRGIASGEMVGGRKVAVAVFDPSNPADAVVVAVWV